VTERELPQPLPAVSIVLLTIGLAGCQRGCLSSWFDEHTGASSGDPAMRHPGADASAPRLGGAGPGGSRGPTAFDFGGTDCSDGLARCFGGRIQVSVAGHVPAHCTAPKELPGACACAWAPLDPGPSGAPGGTCAAGCAKEGLEVEASPEVAREQLCASLEPTLRFPTPGEAASVTICADEGVSCIANLVQACTGRGQPARLAGVCVSGCAPGVSLQPEDLLTGDGAASILCRRRAPVERR
jgi:hypothetical protein